MTDWVVTLPQKIDWEDYVREIEAVQDGMAVMNFRVPFLPLAREGDRCFLVWRGEVRGWMKIVGVASYPGGFRCMTTGKNWPPGFYIQRSGPFHYLEAPRPQMRGFQGIRRYNGRGS